MVKGGKPQLKYYVHGVIDRAKLVRLRVGDPRDPPMPAGWYQGRGGQDRALTAWKQRKRWGGILVACDVDPKGGAKEYSVMRLRDFVTMMRLQPPPNRCYYEQSTSPDDFLDLDEPPMVRLGDDAEPFDASNYMTPINFHADVEVYFAHNTIKSLDDWALREPYYLKYIERYLLETGLLKDPKDLDVIVLDSSNQEKVSRHYIWKIRGVMFYCVRDCSALCRNLETHIACDPACGSPQRPDHLWYVWDEKGRDKSFLFDSIYTDHRCFRFNGCTKLEKNRWLHLHAGMQDLIPRGTPASEVHERELMLDAMMRSSMCIPHPDSDVQEINLVRLYEPDGVTIGRSSSARPRYTKTGELATRSRAARIVEGVANSGKRVHGTVTSMVRTDAYRLMSQIKWKGKGPLQSNDPADGSFAGCKPVFTEKFFHALLTWLFEQTLRDVYGKKIPDLPPPGLDVSGDGGGEPSARRPGKLGVVDVPIGDICGRKIDIRKMGFAASSQLVYCQLADPLRFCPVMHIDGRVSKNALARLRGQTPPPPGPYKPGTKPMSLFHDSNNTGLAASFDRRTWWWSCPAKECQDAQKYRLGRMERPIPDEVWAEFAPAIEQLRRELKEVFSRNLALELVQAQEALKNALPEQIVTVE